MRHSAVRAFLHELIDYAGLFPPAALSMEGALAEYARARGGPQAWMLGSFVVPVSRLEELTERVPVSLVCDGPDLRADCEAVRAYASRRNRTLRIRSIEARLPDSQVLLDACDLPAEASVFVEIPWNERAVIAEGLGALARRKAAAGRSGSVFAKLRCGGKDVPGPEDVAAFIAEARRLAVPFKLTAGLHHPVARSDASGNLAAHGFLNVVGAAALGLLHGLDAGLLAEMLRDDQGEHFRLDARRFAWRAYEADAVGILVARASFVRSIGNCDFFESLGELAAMGVQIR